MNQNNLKGWDMGRFVRTLSFFGVIPFLSDIGWFQQLLGSRPNPKLNSLAIARSTSPANAKELGVVLVAGATGGVGKRVVWRLIERGYQVRALVREAERAEGLFDGNVDIVEADMTIPETLTSALLSNVKAIVCCTGARVQPIGGDTLNREKYYQGIKFYLPEVVDTPELIEYRGVKNLVQAAAKDLGKASETVFDFQTTSNDLKDWGAVDDVVMGGVSESTLRFIGFAALFSGSVSTANSGGFASVRTRNFNLPLNVMEYDGVELRVRGDGKRYKFMLRTESKWDGVAYCYSFNTVAGAWINIRIPFADFIPVFRAKTVKTADPFDPSHIYAFQLMLSKFEYDAALNPTFEPGSFQLQIESVKVYRDKALPQFVMVSSAGVTCPGKPDVNLEEPPAVRMNDQLGGILTWKLRGEESVRESGIPYTIIRPCALTEEPGGQALIADQGDTLKGKVSREDIAELCVQALEHPQACGVTFEVAERQDGCSPGDWACLFSKLQPDVT